MDTAPDSLIKKEFANQLFKDFSTLGFYSPKTKNNPASISLCIKAIYYPIHYFAYFSPMTTLLVTNILAHEVAHHLVKTKGYIFSAEEKYPVYEKSPKYEEEMANRYAFEVLQRMKKKLYYKLGAKMMNFISDCYYGVAAARWDGKYYKSAADYWYKSFRLNSERKETVEWFWYSIKKTEENY